MVKLCVNRRLLSILCVLPLILILFSCGAEPDEYTAAELTNSSYVSESEGTFIFSENGVLYSWKEGEPVRVISSSFSGSGAELAAVGNTVYYSDRNGNLIGTDLDSGEERIVASGLPISSELYDETPIGWEDFRIWSDGEYIYCMNLEQVIVVSPDGEILRRIPFAIIPSAEGVFVYYNDAVYYADDDFYTCSLSLKTGETVRLLDSASAAFNTAYKNKLFGWSGDGNGYFDIISGKFNIMTLDTDKTLRVFAAVFGWTAL